MEICSEVVVFAKPEEDDRWVELAWNSMENFDPESEDKNGLFEDRIDKAERWVKEYALAKAVQDEVIEDKSETVEIKVTRVRRTGKFREITVTETVEVQDE